MNHGQGELETDDIVDKVDKTSFIKGKLGSTNSPIETDLKNL